MATVKLVTWVLALSFGLSCTACIPSATDEELGKMCENLIRIRGEIDASTIEEMTAAIKERFQREEKRLTDWKKRDLKGWDDEMNAKLEATEDVAEKAQIAADYAKKKQVTASKHDPGITALPKKMAAALEDAKKKVAANQSAWAAAVTSCVAEAKKEGVSQKVAQCRISADSTDKYWNGCR